MLKKIQRGNTRELIIYLALTLELSFEETQKMLRKYNEPELYARNRRDSIIIWALYHPKKFKEIDELCDKYNCPKVGIFSNKICKEIKWFIHKIKK